MDFDFTSGEALIEEIQNDWLRKAERHLQLATSAIQSGRSDYSCYGEKYNAEAMLSYTQKVLKRYSKTWSEAAMFSAIHLIKEELGINKIFYHQFDTGRYMKNITGACPPKSLYSRLPKSFCFTQTSKGPDFILSNKKIKRRLNKLKNPNWYYLEVGC
ncbi:hypothetical protein [Aliikangiella sp. IMCC44359]|uniref:hypothetical protein n=1 Tax=Aliikangiella sp. IMCC44359 TaxID=3459125 RepID=UPI00403ACF0F